MDESDDLVNREEERARLQALLGHGAPRLALVYGRRRVGKTHLLNRTWPREHVFYFTASETTEEQNRETLVREAGSFLGETLSLDDYRSWRSIFGLLLEMRPDEPLVVVLDEFQYVGEKLTDVRRVASDLNAMWERRRPSRPLLVVLSGSHVKTMEALIESGPLFGRFNYAARIRPFNYWYSAQMVPGLSRADQVRAYAAFGGTPRYLAAIDPAQSLDTNIANLLLHPQGEVRGLLETALAQERGLQEVHRYQAILRAIGTGSTSFPEIRSKAGLQETSETPVRHMLAKLQELDYVGARRNVGAKRTSPFRYVINDPALAFYYQFTARHEAALARNAPLHVWHTYMRDDFDSYIGHIFEWIAEQAYARLTAPLGLPAVSEWGRWEGQDRSRQSLEMDIVAPLVDGRVMTGGVKWNAKPLDAKWHYHHMAMLKRLEDAAIPWAREANQQSAPIIWIAAGGFTEEFLAAVRRERAEVYLWSLEDLYR
jgi:AAA+ ATPase superfamily predicted ATPase